MVAALRPATDTQILITREFDEHLVYKALTTPELIKRWWAGSHGDATIAEVDLRVGGSWRYVLVANGGFEVGFHGEYREIVPNERIVCTEIYEGVPEPEAGEEVLNTYTLLESGGCTTLTLRCDHPSKEVRDLVLRSGMESGMQESYDQLEQVAISLL